MENNITFAANGFYVLAPLIALVLVAFGALLGVFSLRGKHQREITALDERARRAEDDLDEAWTRRVAVAMRRTAMNRPESWGSILNVLRPFYPDENGLNRALTSTVWRYGHTRNGTTEEMYFAHDSLGRKVVLCISAGLIDEYVLRVEVH